MNEVIYTNFQTEYIKIPKKIIKVMLSELQKVMKSNSLNYNEEFLILKRMHEELEVRLNE